jgi:RNA polymerase sigma factor (sigma-70 family)
MHGTLAPVAGLARRSRGADDSALARRAAAGDGDAFAELYQRHEGRVHNLCYRILGSRDDAADATQEAFVGVLRTLPKPARRDLAFGSYVLTSARNACYDLIERGKRAQTTEEVPATAGPVGGGFDPGDPDDDPERNVLLEARTEEIRIANLALPERQREVLALRELEELSYDEIAAIMDMNRNSVAQLISRARINLRDALRGTALASIAAGSADCERALPLIALEEDGQLVEDSNEAGWLGEHLMHCGTCRLRRDAVQEAGISYRAWLPIAAGPLLFRETMARAADHVGADWSEAIARHEARPSGAAAGGAGAAGAGSARAAILRHRRRNLTLIAGLACVLIVGVLVGAASNDDPAVVPAAGEEPAAAEPAGAEPAAAPAPTKAAKKRERAKRARRARRARRRAAAPPPEPVEPVAVPTPEPEPQPAAPEPEPRRARPRPRQRPERRREGGRQRRPAPETTPEPPPPPPTETTPAPPPPTETTPAPPPPTPPPPCPPSQCPPGP